MFQMKVSFRIIALIIFISTALVLTTYAKEVKFEASLDSQEVALGMRAQLGLTFYGTQNIPAPDIDDIQGLEIRYLGPSTMMTVINGRVSSSITHMYSVLPLKTGKFQIGPFSFKFKGDDYTSNIVFLEVGEGILPRAPKREKEEVITEKLNIEDRIFITLNAGVTKAHVNELIPITVKLYVNRLNVSDIQLPTFGQEGFSKVEFKEPRQYKEEVSGLIYDVLEFKTHIFGTRPGEYALGPARVKCNIVVKKIARKPLSPADEFFEDESFRDSTFEDFFTRFERHPLELKSQDIPIMISPLPIEGKPADFSGAIGDYQFIFNANPTKVKVGDPITISMDINGKGNFNTVLIPQLENTDGFKVYEPQVKTEESRKAFTQVVIPETDQITQTPKAAFSYFDTNTGTYKTIAQGPIPIRVEKGKEEAPAQVVGPLTPAPSIGREEELKRDIIYIKESPGELVTTGYKLYRNKAFLTFILISLLFFISLYAFHARNERLRRNTGYARRIRAFKEVRRAVKALKHQLKLNEPKAFYETMFKALQDYLGDRLQMPSGGITADTADSVLSRKGVELNITGKIRSLFDICDKTRFALLQVDGFRMKDDLKELEEVFEYLERRRI